MITIFPVVGVGLGVIVFVGVGVAVASDGSTLGVGVGVGDGVMSQTPISIELPRICSVSVKYDFVYLRRERLTHNKKRVTIKALVSGYSFIFVFPFINQS